MTTSNQVSKTSRDQGSNVVMAEGSVRSLANGIFEKLRNEGCNTKDIISVSSHLLSLVTDEITRKDSHS